MILLTSEKFVKGTTNIDDNLQGSYLSPAIRESQEIELTKYLGSALVAKLQKLVGDNEIDNPENEMYKELLEKVQYFLAYQAVSKVILICSAKISNLGASQANDENIRSLDLEETLKLGNIYQMKADSYAKLLQQYILENAYAFPEVGECGANAIKAELKSAASTGLFLGGDRGKKVRKGGDCCGNFGSGGHSGGGGEGSVVSWSQYVTGGTKIATITIDGRPTQVFVPEGMTEEQVNALINDAIAVETARTEETYAKESELGNYVTTAETENFATTADTQDLDSRVVDLENEILEKQDELVPGSGISIDGNVISCTVSGGSEEQNYRIVDSLSEITEPYEGLKAYVKSGSSTTETSGIVFYASEVAEDFVAKLYKGGNEIWTIYKSGNSFHWDWNNDGEVHKRENGTEYCWYKTDGENGNFYIFPDDISSYTVEVINGTSGETSTGITTTWASASYMYNGSDWVVVSDLVYVLDNMLQSERAALVSYLVSLTEDERIGAHIYRDKEKCRYGGVEEGEHIKINFKCDYVDNGLGCPALRIYDFWLKDDGSFENVTNGIDFGVPLKLRANYGSADSGLTAEGFPMWAVGSSLNYGSPINIVLYNGTTPIATSKNGWVFKGSDNKNHIGAEWELSGTTIAAQWSNLEFEATLEYWTEGGGGGGYVLPIASQSTLGGIKVGSGLTIDSGGTLSATGGGDGGGFELVVINEITDAERLALYNEINAMSAPSDAFNKYVFYYHFNDGPNGDNHYVPLDTIANYRGLVFRGSQTILNGSANGTMVRVIRIQISNSNGAITIGSDRYTIPLSVYVNSSSAITYDESYYGGYFNRMGGNNCPVSLRIDINGFNCTSTSSVVVNEDNQTPYLYADLVDWNGNTWEAKWKLQKNQTPIYFRLKSGQIIGDVGNVAEPYNGLFLFDLFDNKLKVYTDDGQGNTAWNDCF